MAPEVRLERMHPAEVRAAMAVAPIAWLPLGAVEYHAEHLPFGTDGFSAQSIVERASAESIELFPVGRCYHAGVSPPVHDGLVLGYAALPEHDFDSGLDALDGVLAAAAR